MGCIFWLLLYYLISIHTVASITNQHTDISSKQKQPDQSQGKQTTKHTIVLVLCLVAFAMQ
jgi:hypothetical protein